MTLSILFATTMLLAAPLSGRVVDAAGQPLAGARVFAEPGLAGALIETATDAQGNFAFAEAPSGSVGVFAHAPGHAFGGEHLNIAPGAELAPVTIQLRAPASISGKVENSKGKPVSGARITRIALQEQKVGIPLAKLKSLGFEEPSSGADGAFTVGSLPEGGRVALKAGHPLYAQEAVGDIAVGEKTVKVTLYEGVLLEGIVVTRAEQTPVARASIVITSAQPPQDSAITYTDNTGEFAIRLKPGNYIYRATAVGWQSPGWVDLTVSGNAPLARTRLVVARAGQLSGVVKDAKTGAPIPGARLSLESNGNAAAVVRTGQDGKYTVDAVEGENVLRLDSAPGYLPPAAGPTKIILGENEQKALPDLWLLPLPQWRVQVIGPDQQPAEGVMVSLLRPSQFGWNVTNAQGFVTLDVGNLPVTGTIVGLAEHVKEPLGAIFQLTAEKPEGARVQLLPLASLHGKVTDSSGKALEGAVVGSVFPGESAEQELLLWRCLTGDSGEFSWASVIPGVPQVCVARTGQSVVGQSTPWNTEPGSAKTVEAIAVSDGVGENTLYGKTLSWTELPVLCGAPPTARSLRGRPSLVIYCAPDEAEAVIGGLNTAPFQQLIAGSDLAMAVVVSGGANCGPAAFPVLSGVSPTRATTYLSDRSGKVMLQTFGMPPLHALQQILASR